MRAGRRLLAGLAIAYLPCVSLVACADVIELTDGQRIVGKVKDATPTGVVIQVRGKDVRIRQERVRSVTFEAEPPPVAKPGQVAKSASAMPAPEPARPAAPTVTYTTTVVPPRERPVPPQVAAALTVLGALQDATVNALPPADYTAKVAQVRRDVQHALAEAPDDGDVRSAITAAVDYHAFAALAETVYERRGDLDSIGRNAVVAECHALNEQIAREAGQLRLDPSNPSVIGLLTATEGAASLRECAGEKIVEAESLARSPR